MNVRVDTCKRTHHIYIYIYIYISVTVLSACVFKHAFINMVPIYRHINTNKNSQTHNTATEKHKHAPESLT